MQANTPTAISSYDGSIADTVDAFVDTVTDALADTDADTEAIEAVQQAGSDVADAVEEEIQQRDDTIDELKDELKDAQDHAGQERAELSKRVSDVEDTIDDMADTDSREAVSPDSEPKGSDGQSTPLETVCTLDESTAVRELTSNQRRARALAKDYTDYARKCPDGLVMQSSEVRRVLTAMEDNTIYRKTVSRVMDFLSRLGGDGARVVETRSGEKAICVDEGLANRVSTVDTAEPQGGVTQAIV